MSTATTMQSFVEEYLEERRRLGFASRSMGYALRSFAAYVDGLEIIEPLRIEVMARWARCPKNASDDPLTWARRLKFLRPFARWFRQFEPGTAVPDNSIFGSVAQRLAPHSCAAMQRCVIARSGSRRRCHATLRTCRRRLLRRLQIPRAE